MIQNKQVELRGIDIGGGPIISLKQRGDYSRRSRPVKENVRRDAWLKYSWPDRTPMLSCAPQLFTREEEFIG